VGFMSAGVLSMGSGQSWGENLNVRGDRTLVLVAVLGRRWSSRRGSGGRLVSCRTAGDGEGNVEPSIELILTYVGTKVEVHVTGQIRSLFILFSLSSRFCFCDLRLDFLFLRPWMKNVKHDIRPRGTIHGEVPVPAACRDSWKGFSPESLIRSNL